MRLRFLKDAVADNGVYSAGDVAEVPDGIGRRLVLARPPLAIVAEDLPPVETADLAHGQAESAALDVAGKRKKV